MQHDFPAWREHPTIGSVHPMTRTNSITPLNQEDEPLTMRCSRCRTRPTLPLLASFCALVLLAVSTLTGCGNSPEKARKELAALGKDYTPEAFVKAAYDGDVVAVKLFLGAGMLVNAKAEGGPMAILSASLKGHTEVIKLLLANGADVNSTDANGIPALTFSIHSGKIEAFKLLLERGPDLNPLPPKGLTPLMTAASEGRTDMMDLLLAKGASINATNLAGGTAFIVAATEGRTNSVALLLDKKAQWWVQDKSGMTGSDYAILRWARSDENSRGIILDSVFNFDALTVQFTNSRNPMLELLRKADVNFMTPWFLENYAASTELRMVDTAYGDRQAGTLDFSRTQAVLKSATGFLEAQRISDANAAWFGERVSRRVLGNLETVLFSKTPLGFDPDDKQEVGKRVAAAYRKMVKGVPEKFLKHLPPDEAK